MRRLSQICILLGLALFAVVLWQADLGDGMARLAGVGWAALGLVAVYAGVMLLDSVVWLIAWPGVPLNPRWLGRLMLARLIGEAVNGVTPGGLAGEPVKLTLLHRRHGLDLQAGVASVVVGRTLNLLGLLPFIALGLALTVSQASVSPALQWAAVVTLLALTGGVAAFFAIQRLALSSQGAGWLSRWLAGGRFQQAITAIRAVEDGVIGFYRGHPLRLVAGASVGFAQFCFSVLEGWLALALLGQPVDYATALMLEALVQLVRTSTFFVPGNLGTQDGAFVVLARELGLVGSLGLGVAVLRRFRELVFTLAGFGCGLIFSVEGLSRPPPKR